MKKISIISGFFLLLLIGGTSCKKYLDINKNPNAAAEPPIAGLLANTTNLTAYNVYDLSNYTSYYVQYLASPSVSSTNDTYDRQILQQSGVIFIMCLRIYMICVILLYKKG